MVIKISDFQITVPPSANLRAERDGTGDGRIHTLTVQCMDATGNSTVGTTTVTVVTVRHNQSGKLQLVGTIAA